MGETVGFSNLLAMRILVSLGENAVSRGGDDAGPSRRRQGVDAAAEALSPLASENELVLVGDLGPPLELALRNALPDRDLITVVTEVIVSTDDPAFAGSSGPEMPAPEPSAIAALRGLRVLLEAGVVVVCIGGIPIALDRTGALRSVEAAIDPDLTAALLARRLDADLMLVLTEFDAVHADREDRALRSASPAELRELDFAGGPLVPRVEGACRFVEATGRPAAIGALRDAAEIARGSAGTQISTRRA